MTEDRFLEHILELAGGEGYPAAYEALLEGRGNLPDGGSPTVHYYLMCLAAGCGKQADALRWVAEAEERGWWYRKDAMEDDDLEALRALPAFQRFLRNCQEREAAAKAGSRTECTFRRAEKPNLLLCLHGNGQSGATALRDWAAAGRDSWQMESLQSARPDSSGKFRWEDDDADWKQLSHTLDKLPLTSFSSLGLAGFSAGCNMILRTLTLWEGRCDRILLQSPWIPYWADHREAVAAALKKKGLRAQIACGSLDADCLPMARGLYDDLLGSGVPATLLIQEGTAHSFPAGDDLLGLD